MPEEKNRRQFGLWDSPISPALMATEMKFADVAWNDDGSLVWLEQRPDRAVLVVLPPGESAFRDLNSQYSARCSVGYGGGEFTTGKGYVYFHDAASKRLYRQPVGPGPARPVTPAFGSAAAPTLSPDGKWLVFVHTYEEQDSLAIVDSAGNHWPGKLVSGHDFYMQPAWSPDGARLAWVAWNHPNMPWDGTTLHLGELEVRNGQLPRVGQSEVVAGGDEISILQPEFSPDGHSLAYISDESGWWQLYLLDLKSGEHRQVTHEAVEYGAPAWLQGQRTYQFSPDGKHIFIIRNTEGFASLWRIDTATGAQEQMQLGEAYTWLTQPAVSPDGKQLALIASGPSTPARVITYQPGGTVQVRRRAAAEDIPPAAYALPEAITWQGLDGGKVYGLFYPPQSEKFEGSGQPPLIVHIHGGPTSQAPAAFDLRAQFFTSRGYAFLSVNHRGSTGYGRPYRNALRGAWGIYDAQDAVSGAQHLAQRGQVDGARMVIFGGSAGGFTVLKALEDFPGVFKAGVCLYGVSNQFTAAADTHKFELHYSDSLLGPLPEASDLYRERSPIFFVDQIRDAIILFQGEDDPVVPRDQSDAVVASLQQRGVAHEYHLYPGEGHGFRKKETIEHFYKTVVRFLKQHVIYS